MRLEFFHVLFSPLKGRVQYAIKEHKWRKMNQHNYTSVDEYAPIDQISVGKETYGKLNVHWYEQKAERLDIGNFCSIAGNVNFILGGEHDTKRLTMYPFPEIIYQMEFDGICKGPIIVEDDVWIGFGAIILSGVTLGKGCVVGAGTVVSKNVPPYAVYAGGRIIKYRFSEDVISKLQNFSFEHMNYEKYKKFCKTEITSENVDEILEQISG